MIILERTDHDIEETTLSSEISHTRKVAGSIPTVVRQIFSLSGADTQSGTHSIMFYTTNKNF